MVVLQGPLFDYHFYPGGGKLNKVTFNFVLLFPYLISQFDHLMHCKKKKKKMLKEFIARLEQQNFWPQEQMQTGSSLNHLPKEHDSKKERKKNVIQSKFQSTPIIYVSKKMRDFFSPIKSSNACKRMRPGLAKCHFPNCHPQTEFCLPLYSDC